MALFAVIPELRARGFLINLAALNCHDQRQEELHVDSVAIFRLGAHKGIRWKYDARLFGEEQPRKPDKCNLMYTASREEDEAKSYEEMREDRWLLEEGRGHGFPLAAYFPGKNENQQIGETMRRLTFTVQENPSAYYDEETWETVTDDMENQPAMQGLIGDGAILNLGRFDTRDRLCNWLHSTTWANDYRMSRQKLADVNTYDMNMNVLAHGAHRPVQCIFGHNREYERSGEGRLRRNRKKKHRYEQRHRQRSHRRPRSHPIQNEFFK